MNSYAIRAYSLRLFICTCAFLLVANPSYGTLITGENFDYSVNEFFTNLSGPDFNHTYGTPYTTGDKLGFAGLKFSSTTSGQNNIDMLDGFMEVTIQAHDGRGLSNIQLYENGGYHYRGPFGGQQTTASVDLVDASLQITEIEGESVNLPPVFKNMVFSPSQLFKKTIDPISGNWEGWLNISVSDLLANTEYAGKNITKAVLRFDNVLTTSSDAPGAYAYIDKKIVQITTIDVPEPSVLIMLSIGVLGFGVWRRKKMILRPGHYLVPLRINVFISRE